MIKHKFQIKKEHLNAIRVCPICTESFLLGELGRPYYNLCPKVNYNGKKIGNRHATHIEICRTGYKLSCENCGHSEYTEKYPMLTHRIFLAPNEFLSTIKL